MFSTWSIPSPRVVQLHRCESPWVSVSGCRCLDIAGCLRCLFGWMAMAWVAWQCLSICEEHMFKIRNLKKSTNMAQVSYWMFEDCNIRSFWRCRPSGFEIQWVLLWIRTYLSASAVEFWRPRVERTLLFGQLFWSFGLLPNPCFFHGLARVNHGFGTGLARVRKTRVFFWNPGFS